MEKINETHKIDGLKYLSNTHRELMKNRQKYEWRAVYNILGFYIIATSAFYYPKNIIIDSPSWLRLCFFILMFGVFPILTIYYLMQLHIANEKNKSFAHFYEQLLHSIVQNKEESTGYTDYKSIISHIKFPRFTYWALIGQISIILLFAFVSYILISSKCSG